MKKIFTTVLIFVLIGVLSFGLISCSNNYVKDIPNNDDYSLVEQSGKNYIVFNNISMYQNDGQNVPATLEFEDMATFKDSVVNGKLFDWQKATIATAFRKDELDRILVCDFNNLFDARVPDDCKIDSVGWEGETYSFSISTSSNASGFFHYYTKTQYDDIFKDDFENYFNKETITIIESTETVEGKMITMYSTGVAVLKNIRYTITDKNRTIVVDETYVLDIANELIQTSSTIPSNVTLYCVDEEAHYIVDLFDFEETPSELWLREFSMQPYADSKE